jgi:hypothetical protein
MARERVVLDGFFHPRSAEDVAEALRAIPGQSAGPLPWSWGTSNVALAPELFGPVERDRCACGKIGGPRGRPKAFDGERCDRCGVEALSESPRATRWGHVDLPAPVVHRAAPGLVVDRVPVPPAGDRSVDAQGLGGVDTAIWDDFLRAVRVVQAVQSFAEGIPSLAPELAKACAALQGDFEGLCAVMEASGPFAAGTMPPDALYGAGEDDGPLRAMLLDHTESYLPDLRLARAGTALAGAFVGTDVVLQLPYAVVHLGRRGHVRGIYPGRGLRKLIAVSRGGQVLFESHLGALSVLDPERRGYVEAIPDDLPCVVMVEAQEQAYLSDLRRGRVRAIPDLGDYPTIDATSPDGRYLWTESKHQLGGIYEATTALRVCDVRRWEESAPVPVLFDDRVVTPGGGDDDDDDEPPHEGQRHALVRAEDGRFLVVDETVVLLDGEPLLALEKPGVVALHPSGDQLLVVRGAALTIVELFPTPRLAVRLDLSSLVPSLTLDGLGLGGRRRAALVARFGSAHGVKAAPAEDVAAAVGRAAAKRVLAALRRRTLVDRLARPRR